MSERREKIAVFFYALRALAVVGGVVFFAHQSDFSLRVAGLPSQDKNSDSCADGASWASGECLASQRHIASLPEAAKDARSVEEIEETKAPPHPAKGR